MKFSGARIFEGREASLTINHSTLDAQPDHDMDPRILNGISTTAVQNIAKTNCKNCTSNSINSDYRA